MIIKQVTIDSQFANFRLDKWFKHNYPQISFIIVAKLCRKGQIRLDGKRTEPGVHLQPGQVLRFPLLSGQERPLNKKEISTAKLRDLHEKILNCVIFQDADLIVINKPSEIAVQGGNKVAVSIADILPLLKQSSQQDMPRIVHRLDKSTSGILLLANNLIAAIEMGKLFQERSINKEYLAITVGIPPLDKGEIDLPINKTQSGNYEKMRPSRADDSLPAITYYEVLNKDKATNRALLLLKPITGRTHQLRVHCSARGFPILGDNKYGNFTQNKAYHEDKLFLHAYRIQLPWKEQILEFKARLPKYFTDHCLVNSNLF
jgi:23S rRNA pseudouridine955/2504/2580 synthase